MTRFANTALAACTAVLLTFVSIGMVISAPGPHMPSLVTSEIA